MLGDPLAVGLDHFARHRAGERAQGQEVREVGRRFGEFDAQRVAVRRAQPFDLAVVVEAAGLLRLRAQPGHAENAGTLEGVVKGALGARVEEALDRVDVVGRRQLAPLPAEGGVVGEVDARPQADGECAVVVADLRQRRRRARLERHRARQVVVGVRRLQDVGDDGARVQVVDLRRVEAGLGDRKAVAQCLRLLHLLRLCGGQAGGRQAAAEQEVAPMHVALRAGVRALRGDPP